MVNVSQQSISNTLARFLSGAQMLTHTTDAGIELIIDSKHAILLSFNLRDVLAIVHANIDNCIAMTFTDAVFIRHLLYLRSEMLKRMNKLSLHWELIPEYYIQLSNGKKFSLPSLLIRYAAAAKRDTITLSAGLWKYMWYYNIIFNLNNTNQLMIHQTGDVRDMLRAEFIYKDTIYTKGQTIRIREEINHGE